MTDNLDALAVAIVTAQAQVDRTSIAVSEAQARVTKITGSKAALATERGAIKARRAGGDLDEGDGPRLAIIAADTENLDGLLSEAEYLARDAQAGFQKAGAALAAAHAAYQAEERRLTLQAMDDHADHLLQLLAETVARRLEAGAAMPRGQKGFDRTVAQLTTFDRIASAQMHALRTASYGLAAYGGQAWWKPSQTLYENVWRLHATDGSFA